MAAPLRHGGQGFTRLTDVAPFAFWGATANASYALRRFFPDRLPPRFSRAIADTLARLSPLVSELCRTRWLPPVDSSAEEVVAFYAQHRTKTVRLQSKLWRSACKIQAAAHLRSLPELQAAALLAARAPGASNAHTLPLTSSTLGDAARVQAARMRAQHPPAEQMPPVCHCGERMDEDPYHALKHIGLEASQGHNEIAKVLVSVIEMAGGRAWIEPRFQMHYADDQHTDIRFALGAVLGYIDVSVVHPTGASVRRRASQRPLATARRAEQVKDRKYLARATAEHALFFPFIVETFGGWGVKAKAFGKLLADYAADHSARWTANDIRVALRKGVSEQLQLRNLRLLSDQLSQCHMPPPRYQGLARTSRRTRRPSQSPSNARPSTPRDPPGPPGPPGHRPGPTRARSTLTLPRERRRSSASRSVSSGTVTVQSGRRTLEEHMQIRFRLREARATSPRPAPTPALERADSTPVDTNQEASQPLTQPTDSPSQEGAPALANQAQTLTQPLQGASPTPLTTSAALRLSRPPDASSPD